MTEWAPNLKRTKMHRAVYGWSGSGTGIVAQCDKKGIFLDDSTDPNTWPETCCLTCSRLTPHPVEG